MNKVIYIVFIILVTNISYSQWVRISGNIDALSLSYTGNKMYAGTYNEGVYYSSNNGLNWVQTSLNNQAVFSLACIGNYVIAGTWGYGIYYSTNNGTSWVQSNLVSERVLSLAVIGNNIFAGTNDKGVYISVNNGVSWSQTSMNNMDVNYLHPSGSILFAGVGEGGWSVFVTVDNGITWIKLGDAGSTYSVAVSGNYIYAGPYYSGIQVSSNSGVTWTQTSLDIGTVVAIAVIGNNVFAGMEGFGFKVSNDNGNTWTHRSEGLGSGYLSALCIINNTIYAGTGSGVYKRSLSEIIGINKISNEIPKKSSLSQNYPNPFNPTTKIKFQIPLLSTTPSGKGVDAIGGRGVLTQLIIYDVLGREIATLVNEQLSPGSYEVDFDGSSYPSGVYFYKLSTGNFTAVNKMVLLK